MAGKEIAVSQWRGALSFHFPHHQFRTRRTEFRELLRPHDRFRRIGAIDHLVAQSREKLFRVIRQEPKPLRTILLRLGFEQTYQGPPCSLAAHRWVDDQ